eukprot:tig00001374_g8498.t1
MPRLLTACPGPSTTQNFAKEHCHIFTDDEENKLEYTDVYKKFCALFEKKLMQFCESQGMSSEEFYRLCNEVQKNKEGTDAAEFAYTILRILLASFEFEGFITLMREARDMGPSLRSAKDSEGL